MSVEFSRRAVADLRKIGTDCLEFGDAVAIAVEVRISEVIAHISAHPEAAPQLSERPEVRVASLIRYPYRIFYRVLPDRVRILHIRHTSRRPWPNER